MTQIIKDLNAEEVRIEEPAREEKNEGCKKIKLKNAKLTVVRVFDKINKNKYLIGGARWEAYTRLSKLWVPVKNHGKTQQELQ
jgi:hypothetical protein